MNGTGLSSAGTRAGGDVGPKSAGMRDRQDRAARSQQELHGPLRQVLHKSSRACFPMLLVVLAAGCTVGPAYKRPTLQTPARWQAQGPWQPSQPRDQLPKGAWWRVFADAQLDSLENHALAANQSLAAAIAGLDQARAFAHLAEADIYPQVGAQPSLVRQRFAGTRPGLPPQFTSRALTQTAFVLPLSVGYEADLFGRVRRSIEAAGAAYQASAADLENTRLLVTAEVASDYFYVRQLDSETAVVSQVLAELQRALAIVERRHAGGIASGIDVAQQQALVEGTRTQITLLAQQRSQYVNALATLIGTPAPRFHLAAAPTAARLPAPPLDAPSVLLERRPDVAAQERAVAAANAEVGVARSAFFPNVVLQAAGGTEGTTLGALFSAPSFFWSVGAAATEAVFTGGRNTAQLQGAEAAYRASVAQYRNTALAAFEEVEDALDALTLVAQANASQKAAIAAARRSLELANNQYIGGIANYLNVIAAQQTLLADEQLAAQLQGQQYVISVQLIRALGGGWDAADLARYRVRPKLSDTLKQ
jgi:multidrug efflux system outer membrane protein